MSLEKCARNILEILGWVINKGGRDVCDHSKRKIVDTLISLGFLPQIWIWNLKWQSIFVLANWVRKFPISFSAKLICKVGSVIMWPYCEHLPTPRIFLTIGSAQKLSRPWLVAYQFHKFSFQLSNWSRDTKSRRGQEWKRSMPFYDHIGPPSCVGQLNLKC